MEDIGFYKKLLDNISDGAYFVDRNGKITYWNKAAENISGYREDEVIGKQCSDNILIHLDSEGNKLCLNGCPLKKSITDGTQRTADVFLHHKKGFRLPVAVRVAPIKSDDGEIIGAVELFSDNSSKVTAIQKIKELENMVYSDQLTGLANRKYIEIFLHSRLEEMQRYNWPFGILFVDIDHFKSINDTHGHDIGDDVLIMVAKTLIKNVRPFDAVGRWGGEEFVCVITNIHNDQLIIIAEKLRILTMQSNLLLNNYPLSVTVSIGAVTARHDDTLESIIRRADLLMYESKIKGRNCITMEHR